MKEQEEDDLLTINTRPPLENVNFLLTYDFNSPASDYNDDSPTSVVRIPESYVSSVDHLSQGEAKNKNKKNHIETNATTNIRTSPVPPPRAVLSSPDNDALMRSKIKGKAEPLSGSKDHNLRENRHIRCKAIPRKSSCESTKTTVQEPKETREIKSALKEKTRAGLADKSSQRAHERKQKPDWV